MRAKSKPAGRADHVARVQAVKATAAEAGLVALLNGIAADPDAGAWSAWAGKLLGADQADGQKPSPKKRKKGPR